MRAICLSLVILFSTANAGSAEPTVGSTHWTGPVVSGDVRVTARKLAQAWVDSASAETIDALAHRSNAFAGMVPGVIVRLDGKRMLAETVLTNSALTILKGSDQEQDARAARNCVYALMEIANGRVAR